MTDTPLDPPLDPLLYLADICRLTRKEASTIRRWVGQGNFPMPMKLTEARNSPLAWRQSDWQNWLDSRPKGRGATPQLDPYRRPKMERRT
jgi:predicted DNA-binding transcriptional regulator AlpA